MRFSEYGDYDDDQSTRLVDSSSSSGANGSSSANNNKQLIQRKALPVLRLLRRGNSSSNNNNNPRLSIDKTARNVFVEGNDDDICRYVENHPESCQKTYSFQGENCIGKYKNIGRTIPSDYDNNGITLMSVFGVGRGKNGTHGKTFYPLFLVCGRSNELSVETIKLVYEHSPKEPEVINGILHYACTNDKASLDVIKFLVSVIPDGVKVQEKGFLPLHTAVSFDVPLDVVEFLIECDPDSVKQRTSSTIVSNGNNTTPSPSQPLPSSSPWKLPLHLAVQYDAKLEILRLLCKKYPAALQKADYLVMTTKEERGWINLKGKWLRDIFSGGLPLHIACKHKLPMQKVKYIITEYPDALRTKNQGGFLPIHYALHAGCDIEVVESIVVCCPNALLERTVDYRYPIDMCWSKRRKYDNLQLVQYLISKHPTALGVNKPNSYYTLFLHYVDEAEMCFADRKVISFLSHVSERALQGYSFVNTREDRMIAVKKGYSV